MIRQNFFRCGIAGWTLEILWTGLHAFRMRDPKLTGTSSLWMFPIYGSAAFLAPLMRRMKSRAFWQRGLLYMIFIYAAEYLSGSLLKIRGMCPWNYGSSPLHIREVVRLDFAPLWFLVGLLFERILTSSKTS